MHTTSYTLKQEVHGTIYIQSNLDILNPRLSELRNQAKVQVKVQMSGTILMCICAVECSAAIVHTLFVRMTEVLK